MPSSYLALLALAVVAVIAFGIGLVAGYRLGQADQRMRHFVEEERHRRDRAAILELQRRARFESECG